MALVLAAFGQAPFEHTHDSDAAHGHAETLPHAHVLAGLPHGLAWDDHDDDQDARLKDWVTEQGPEAARMAPAILVDGVEFQWTVQIVGRRAERIRNHDPPDLAPLPARGPPSLTLL